MKRGIVILILMTLTIFAQSDLSSSVDVKKIVQQQIEEAKKKEMESSAEKEIIAEQKEEKNESEVLQKPENESEVITLKPRSKSSRESNSKPVSIWNTITNNMEIVKYAVLGFFSVIVMSFVAVRRSKLNKKHVPKNDFKENIKLVRAEKFIKPIDPDLKKIRTNLTLTSKYLNTSEHYVTETAKKYSLAKTEIMLAAKFRNQSAIYN